MKKHLPLKLATFSKSVRVSDGSSVCVDLVMIRLLLEGVAPPSPCERQLAQRFKTTAHDPECRTTETTLGSREIGEKVHPPS